MRWAAVALIVLAAPALAAERPSYLIGHWFGQGGRRQHYERDSGPAHQLVNSQDGIRKSSATRCGV